MCVHQKVVCTRHSSDTYTTCLSEQFFFNLFHVCFLHLYDYETLKKRTLSSQLERNPDVLNEIGEGSQV